MKHVLLSSVQALLVSSAFSTAIYAASPEQLQQADILLSADRALEALELLEANFNITTASTQELFLLGISAKQTGQFGKAAEYFQLALQREPNIGRIRLEYAETLFRLGRYKQSHAELITVREMNPPAPVLANVNHFIAIVDAAIINPNQRPQGPQKNWNAYITAGFTSDSNVNGGPNIDTVFLYGLPFTLSEDAKETDDGAWFLRAGFNHQKQVSDKILWRSSVNFILTNYLSADAYDTTSLSTSTGPLFRLSERSTLFMPLNWDIQKYDEQGDWYSQTLSLGPRYQYNASENLQFNVDTYFGKKRFKGDDTRNTITRTLNPSLNYRPSDNGNIAFGFRFGNEDSGQDIYSSNVRAVFLGYEHSFTRLGLTANITGTITETKFEGIQAAYTVAREDLSRQLAATVSYKLSDSMTLDGSLSFQDNDSNLDINTYDRTQLSVSFVRRF
jgi:tetratricopeptide (TPR) repeat protein